MRLSRDEWALGVADAVAEGADCTRAQVGAVILNERKRAIGLGYNGLPSGVPGCASAGNCPRGRLSVEECARDSDYANCAGTHAERNAIEDAIGKGLGVQFPAATLYVTRKPCPACITLIGSVGIQRTVYREESTQCSPPEGPWRSMLNQAVNSRA